MAEYFWYREKKIRFSKENFVLNILNKCINVTTYTFPFTSQRTISAHICLFKINKINWPCGCTFFTLNNYKGSLPYTLRKVIKIKDNTGCNWSFKIFKYFLCAIEAAQSTQLISQNAWCIFFCKWTWSWPVVWFVFNISSTWPYLIKSQPTFFLSVEKVIISHLNYKANSYDKTFPVVNLAIWSIIYLKICKARDSKLVWSLLTWLFITSTTCIVFGLVDSGLLH